MGITAKAIRWTARILSVPIVLVWGFLVLAYAFGAERSLPRTCGEGVSYVAMIVSFLALALAWKRETLGALVSLAAAVVGFTFNAAGFSSPAVLIPADAVLFLLSGWLNGRAKPEA